MYLSVFDIFKIGVGPSSSHTMGPMTAAAMFLDDLRDRRDAIPGAGPPARITCSLHGSLAWTGKGHASDRAVILGLAGETPATLDPAGADDLVASIKRERRLTPDGLPPLTFDPAQDLVFDFDMVLPGHANGLRFEAFDEAGNLRRRDVYYSIGGGFVLREAEMPAAREGTGTGAAGGAQDAMGDAPTPMATAASAVPDEDAGVPYPFANAHDLLACAQESGLTIAQMMLANERALLDAAAVDTQLHALASTMDACINRGLVEEGELPGGLKVKRRAKAIHAALQAERGLNVSQPHVANDWLCVYAMAINEENAAGGKVVTAPTNGAAGVVPAVMRYMQDHCGVNGETAARDYLLTAAAIGSIIKRNASISGAEVGCQGEVGSASAMAAAGLCAALGGTPAQIENAAEIALEHHLGMTCDPIAGLVQVPCIERNGFGAVKAVAAASLSLRGDGQHLMPLDNCIEAMRQTGAEMDDKFKETSRGGLAVNLPEC